jgi:hypothetical protein
VTDTAPHDDVRDIEATLLASVSPGSVSAALRLRVRRAAELMALSTRMRSQALSGSTIDIAEVVKLETIANAAMVDLQAVMPRPVPHVTVEYISPPVDVQVEKLEAEVARLSAMLRAGAGVAAGEGAAAAKVGAPSTNNMVSLQRPGDVTNRPPGERQVQQDLSAAPLVAAPAGARYGHFGIGGGERRGFDQAGDLPYR